jgi:hypothetical protein
MPGIDTLPEPRPLTLTTGVQRAAWPAWSCCRRPAGY